MNTLNEIITLISNIGFPIVACYFLYRQNDSTISKLRDTIEKNTLVITRLMERLESEQDEN